MVYEAIKYEEDFVRLKDPADGIERICSEVYLIQKEFLIDLGSPIQSAELLRTMKYLGINRAGISDIFLTHDHADHFGYPLLFKNARTWLSSKSIELLQQRPLDALHHSFEHNGLSLKEEALLVYKWLKKLNLSPLEECPLCTETGIEEFAESHGEKILFFRTAGHSQSDVCFSYKNYKILGDAISPNQKYANREILSGRTLARYLLKNCDKELIFTSHKKV